MIKKDPIQRQASTFHTERASDIFTCENPKGPTAPNLSVFLPFFVLPITLFLIPSLRRPSWPLSLSRKTLPLQERRWVEDGKLYLSLQGALFQTVVVDVNMNESQWCFFLHLILGGGQSKRVQSLWRTSPYCKVSHAIQWNVLEILSSIDCLPSVSLLPLFRPSQSYAHIIGTDFSLGLLTSVLASLQSSLHQQQNGLKMQMESC